MEDKHAPEGEQAPSVYGVNTHTRRGLIGKAATAGAGVALGGLFAASGESSAAGRIMAASNRQLGGKISYLAANFGPAALHDYQVEAANFHRQNPAATVDFESYEFADRAAVMTADFAGGSPPDLVYTSDSTFAKFAQAGALEDLTPLAKSNAGLKKLRSVTPAAAWNAGMFDGKLWGIPNLAGAAYVIVNKTLLAKAGVRGDDWQTSFPAMIAAAKKVHASGPNRYGFLAAANQADEGWVTWVSAVVANGGRFLNKAATASALDSPAAKAAWESLYDVVQHSAPRYGLYDMNGMIALWNAGRGAFLYTTTQLTNVVPLMKALPFDWDVYMFPGANGHPPTTFSSVGVLNMAAASKDKDLALAYLDYLDQPAQIQPLISATIGGIVPTRTDFTPVYPGSARVKTAAVKIGTFFPKGWFLPVATEILTALQSANAQYETMLNGSAAPEQALHAAHQAVNQALAQA